MTYRVIPTLRSFYKMFRFLVLSGFIICFVMMIYTINHCSLNYIPTKFFPWTNTTSRNISSYISIEENTLFLGSNVSCSQSLNVLFIVTSAPDNFQRRNVIRKTWRKWINGKMEESSNEKAKRMKMHIIFLLGRPQDGREEITSKMKNESVLNNDLVVENFVDSYQNLTLKSVFMLKWVSSKCSHVDFFMKVDDDMFINVPNLEEVLSGVKKSKPLAMGILFCNAYPIENPKSKWFTPPYMFKGKFPNYLSGTAYVLSGKLAKPLLFTALKEPLFHLEDIFITGICLKKLKIRPEFHNGFFYEKRMDICQLKNLITSHGLNSSELELAWQRTQSKESCKAKSLKFEKVKGCSWKRY